MYNYSKSEQFGDSTVDLSSLLFSYFDKYLTNRLRKKYHNYNICINMKNRSKYYSIQNVKIYRNCIVTRKFRKCIIDSNYGDSMASFLTESRNCMLARFFVNVDIIVHKKNIKKVDKNENKNIDQDISNLKSNDSDSTKLINELINQTNINNNNNDNTNKNNMKRLKKKSFNLFVASPFQFLHLSPMKYFRIHNKRVYKLLMNKFVVGNVKDILLTIWMVHACFLDKSDVYKLYGKMKNAKRALCSMIDDTKIDHNCTHHSLFFLDQYAGRWEKILYYKSCYCHVCNQK